ncbi:hypothetical protein J1605_011451 [Eschrichtius robustus]|uniref:3-hydroxyisobutyrate dehydrogenase, mitochondrial n=1 Tax=Eschrichtius robustus TaxID=9764 RepID=A0AB34GQL6_ESCRO|nr:hypothetical protein J1605_011451 [Eschrichtius robustus]
MVSKELAKEVEKMGAVFTDAPVSGGVGAARSGNLTFMVGGVEEEFAAAQELLGCMGSNVVHCGDVGTGQAVKICNNLLLAISMIGTAEAMNLGISTRLCYQHEEPNPSGQAHQIYRMMCAKGYSKKDFSSVFQFLREEEML